MNEIVGVMMVKNEERFIARVLRNIAWFCDRILVVDTGSEDRTLEEVRSCGIKVELAIEPDLRRTHRFIEPFVGTDAWVFGVDGDELYDPVGLERLRAHMEDTGVGPAWRIKGHYLHVTELHEGRATGYLGPPAHNPTKLYNMARITAWPSDGKHTMFHARTRKVREGSTVIEPIGTWDDAWLRCLHMRFVCRSSAESETEAAKRLTPEDRVGYGSRRDRGGGDRANRRASYRVGELVTVPTAPFGELPWR